MSRRWPPPLRWSLPVLLLVVGVASVWAGLQLDLQRFEKLALEDARDDAVLTAVRTAAEIERALGLALPRAARDAIDRAEADPYLGLALLVDDDRRVLFASEQGLEAHTLADTPHAEVQPLADAAMRDVRPVPREQRSGRSLWLAVAVRLDERTLVPGFAEQGALLLRFDLDERLARGRALAYRRTFEVGALFLLLGVVVWLMLARVVTRRVGRLVDSTRAIAAGDFSARSGVAGGDELARLSRSIDRMAGALGEMTAELESRGRWFRQLIEQGSDVIFVVDAAARASYVSPSAARVLGRSPEELEGGAVGELVAAEDAERFASILRRVLAGESDPEREEIRFLGADGRTRVLEIAAYAPPEFLARGECVLNARDLTAWRTLEDRLRQAEKMEAVGRLAGGVAHDFNNLLTVILGHSEMLFSQLAADSAAAGEVAEIERAARRAADLTRQLLAFGRRQLLQPKELDLNRVVRGLESMLRRLIEARIALVLELEPLPLPIHADRAQLETAIVNLALNGRDAMPAGGRLTFSTARIATSAEQAAALGLPVGAGALLRVTDTGEGMPPEVREHAFEPFFTTKDVGRGTGLGLSAVLGIVEQSGGAVRLASELGVGSTFELYFPLLAVDSEPTPSAGFRVEAAPVPGEPLLLVVEDEPSIRQLLVTALGARGFRVLEAATTARALEIAAGAAGTIDLLVTDVVMPGHTGPELAAELRRAQPDLRVLYITGYSEEIVGRSGEPEPGSAVLGKPFTIERLVTRVRDLLAAEAVGGS